jgi:hypothetical protein
MIKFMLSHDFPEPSFAPITKHCPAYFPRYSNSKSPLARVVLQKKGRKKGSVNFLTLLINSAKLLAVAQHLH